MDRQPPPVTVTAPGSGPLPDQPDAAPSRRPRWIAPGLVLAAGAVLVGAVRSGAGEDPPAPRLASGITATASLAGAATDSAYAQRLSVTVDLPASAGQRDRPSAAVLLVRVVARGFAVQSDDPRSPLPLGRFGRASRARSTTVPLEAVVTDCSVETTAPRALVLTVRTGDGRDELVPVASDADVVRALDRLVSRTCRRPRG